LIEELKTNVSLFSFCSNGTAEIMPYVSVFLQTLKERYCAKDLGRSSHEQFLKGTKKDFHRFYISSQNDGFSTGHTEPFMR